ncbi:MAG: hypothetical protein GWN08_06310, partial [Gemmatimonadetes bacterium]|nr:hypothetical protein [Gemmatimonadota bacterium]NIW74860.1 hypothetical protein [Gemmatimonadota bacterium]
IDVVVGVWLVGLPVAAMLAWRLGASGEPSETRTVESPSKSVAVLPFANLSDSPDN